MANERCCIESRDDATLIQVSDSRIDFMLINRIKRVTSSATNFNKSVILNLEAVETVSSLMLSSLIDLLKQFRTAGKRLILAGLSTQVLDAFLHTRLDKLFEIHQDNNSAIDALKKPGLPGVHAAC